MPELMTGHAETPNFTQLFRPPAVQTSALSRSLKGDVRDAALREKKPLRVIEHRGGGGANDHLLMPCNGSAPPPPLGPELT